MYLDAWNLRLYSLYLVSEQDYVSEETWISTTTSYRLNLTENLNPMKSSSQKDSHLKVQVLLFDSLMDVLLSFCLIMAAKSSLYHHQHKEPLLVWEKLLEWDRDHQLLVCSLTFDFEVVNLVLRNVPYVFGTSRDISCWVMQLYSVWGRLLFPLSA